jgi:hypothetical protein
MDTPQSKVRSISLKSANTVQHEYNRVGLALAIFAAFCLFCALWAVNGYFTARTVRSIGLILRLASVSWGAGWLVHIIVSLVEHHLWKARHAMSETPSFVIMGMYCLIIGVGVLDVVTSASDPSVRFVSVVFAEVIAILPESLIVWLAVALWRVIHD